jgi:hypothetical protein
MANYSSGRTTFALLALATYNMKRIIYICFAGSMLLACQPAAKKSDTQFIATPNGIPAASGNTSATPTGVKPLNNPEHGQPFHDCALPVGAPLNSAIPNRQPAETPVPPAPFEAPAQAAPASENVKLNPPHGEPGHDCKIAVGAPLT